MRLSPRPSLALVSVFALLGLVVAACGGGDSTQPAAGASGPTPTSAPAPSGGESLPTSTVSQPTATPPSSPAAGLAPPFTLPTARGGTVSLASYLGERNVVLVFYRAFW